MAKKRRSSRHCRVQRKALPFASLCAFSFCGIFLWTGPALAADVWNGGTGQWSSAGNWNSGLPGISSDVLIDNGNLVNSVVNLDAYASINNLTIDSGDTLNILNAYNLAINGTNINNAGTLALKSTTTYVDLIFKNNVSLTGGGNLTLSDTTPYNRIYSNTAGSVLDNVDNTISGAGTISQNSGLTLKNEAAGIIDATGTNALGLQTLGTVVNNGILRSSNTTAGNGGLWFQNTTIDNTGNSNGGRITALGANTHVDLYNSTIKGGTLTTSGGGVIQTATGYSGTLDGSTAQVNITSGSTFLANNSSNTYLSGTINNAGTIKSDSTTTYVNFHLADGTQLTGGGNLTLSDSEYNRIFGTANNGLDTVTNVYNTISGAGLIGAGNSFEFINQAGNTITANGTNALTITPTTNNSTGLITANGGGFVNKGTLQATNTGGLFLSGGVFNNKDGMIQAVGSSNNVNLQNTTIVGGTLQGVNGGLVQTQSGYHSILDGSTLGALTLGGTYLANNSSNTYLSGTIYNTGTIKSDSTTGYVDLHLAGGTQLTGGGNLTLSDSLWNRIYGTANNGLETLTNVNNTISGAGQIGAGNSFEFINQAGNTITANGTNALTITPTTNNTTGLITANGGGFVNKGTLQATNIGGLVLSGGVFNNKDGVIQAVNSGHDVSLTSTTVAGGTLQGVNGGLVNIASSTLDGNSQDALTLAGTIQAGNGSINYLSGTINNTGTIKVNSTGAYTDLHLAGGTQLAGGGNLTLSDGPYNRIYGTTNTGLEIVTNVNNTISGAGQLGASYSFGIVNSGTINATGSNALVLTPSTNSALTAGLVNQTGGILRGSGAGGLEITQGKIDNQGKVEALANSKVVFDSNATVLNNVGNTLTSGSWIANSGGGTSATIDFQKTNTSIATNNADISLIGANSVIQGRSATNVVQSIDSTLSSNDNLGSLRLQQGRTFNATANSGNFSNAGLLEVTDSIFQSTNLTNSGTISGFDTSTVNTGSNQVTGTGAITANTGALTLTGGVNMGTGSSMTSNAGAAIDLHNASAASNIGTLNNNGSLNIGSQNINVYADYTNANFGVGNSFNNHANVTGTGLILATGNVGISVSGAGVTNGASASPTLALGNVHVGAANSGSFNINNTGTNGPVIRGAIQNTGTGIVAQNFGPISPSGSTTVSYDYTSNTSGLLDPSFNIVTNFDNVAGKTVNVTGAAYDYANPLISPNPVIFGNVHVGTSTAQALSIANTTITNPLFQEGLNASVSDTTGGVTFNGATITNLAAGAAASTAITVGINTGTAGDKSGIATIGLESNGSIDGLSNTALTSKEVTVTGAAYDYANASVTSTPITFGNVHVNDMVAQKAVTIANSTISNADYQEGLDASFGSIESGIITNGGSITDLTAGGSNNAALQVGINTATAGAINSTAEIKLASNGTISSLADTALSSKSVTVTGGVYNLAKSNTIAPLNIVAHVGDGGGSISQALKITNVSLGNNAYQEGLNSSFGSYTAGSGDTLTPTFSGSIINLAAGFTDQTGMTATINTSAAGLFGGSVVVNQASNGTISGLNDTALASQNVGIAGSVTGGTFNYAAATINNTLPIDFGNVRIGSVLANQAISISNTAPVSAFTEALNGKIDFITPGAFTATGSFNGLQATSPASANTDISVGMNTGTAGHQTGTVVLGFESDGTDIEYDGTKTTLSSQNVAVMGKVYRLASPTVTSSPINLFARVGDVISPTPAVSITNSSLDDYTEGLKASIGTSSTGFTAGGSIANLAAQLTDASTLQVGLATGTAGIFTGSADLTLASTGAGTTGVSDYTLENKTVDLNGKVYTAAIAAIDIAAPINFGIVHVGDSVAPQEVIVRNAASSSDLNDVLQGILAVSGGSTGGGSINSNGLGAQATQSFNVSLDTSSAKSVNGEATFSGVSQNGDMTDLALQSVSTTITGQVNNYAVAQLIGSAGNAGTFSHSGTTYTLDFGTQVVGSNLYTATLFAANGAAGTYSDWLNGNFTISDAIDFGEIAFIFDHLAAGTQTNNALSFTFNTATLGDFSDTITLHSSSGNASGYSGAWTDIELIVTGHVVAGGQQPVPEPSTMMLFGVGLSGLAFYGKRRSGKRND